MKLVRWGAPGAEKPGLIDDSGAVRDLSGVIEDVGPETVGPESLDRLKTLRHDDLPRVAEQARLGPCIARPPNIHAIGLNYHDHARETGNEPPAEPVLFSKATSALSGPFDDVIIPRGCEKTDWEVELAFVVGRTAWRVSEEEALEYVAGYCIVNDVSERSFQLERTGQWIKGKSAPTFAPTGPWLVTADEVADPQSLAMWLEVSGTRMQTGNTRTMIFSVAQIIATMTCFMRLMPGDLVATGTPPGVGLGMQPQRFLKPGDTMRLGIDGLGEQSCRVVSEDASSGAD